MEIEEIISTIEDQESISIDESFSFAKTTSILLRNDEEKGRKIIIYILDNWEKLPNETYEIWTDLIESAGFYPYLEKEREKLKFNNLSGEIRKECHLSKNLIGKYFHEEQKYLKEILNDGKNLIVSAPTSFGKSLLIEEIVASKKFKNLVIIQPTLALLDETRKKLKKYKDAYKVIVRTSQEASEEKGNLFLLTAERVMEYKNLPHVDFFVIDEFYKLSARRDDERSDILNNAFYKLLRQDPSPQFYLLGPNIDSISEGFTEKYHAIFYKTKYSLIENKTVDIYSENKEIFDKTSHHAKKGYKEAVKFKEKELFELLLKLKDEQTIIYCSSPSKVRELAKKFSLFLEEKGIKKSKQLPLAEWVERYVDKKWDLISFLNFEIGINDGALQKHINSSMIDYFNEKKLKYMFCTSTIIEGVNTSAKNVVFFDKTKGKILIDYFDYSNIKGRSGRMMVHYIGKIFNFNPPPKKEEEIIVDIPFYQQNPIKDEVLNGLNEFDIKSEVRNTAQYKELLKIPQEERILFQNNGVSIKGQKNILSIISDLNAVHTISRNNYSQEYKIYELINWIGGPKYDQLQFILDLGWDNLIKPGETTSPMTKPKLVTMTSNFSVKKDLFALIKDDFSFQRPLKRNIDKTDEEVLNQSIQNIFSISRHWFQYKIPKWLSVINELQKYICEKSGKTPGNYSFYASQIENDFIRDNLTILSEYGIPTSAINKLTQSIDEDLSEDDVLARLQEISENNSNDLLPYEKDKINKLL